MNFPSFLKKFGFISAGFLSGVIWIAACGGGAASIAETIAAAIDVSYDNDASGLAAENVQAALDELAAANPAAADVSYDNTASGLAADDVQAALDELKDEVDSGASYTDADAVDALEAEATLSLGDVTADTLTFTAAKTGYVSVPGVAFIPDNPFNDPTDNGEDGTTIEYSTVEGARRGDEGVNEEDFSAPVYLPHGATITLVTLYATDGGLGNIELTLNSYDGTSLTEIADIDTNPGAGTYQQASGALSTVVNNLTNAYVLQASIPDSTFLVRRVLITYTYTTPTF